MAQPKQPLGQVQLEVLQYVAEHHPIRVGEVAEHFAQAKGKARTTILTVMERLREKGYLTRKRIRNTWHYSPKISQGEVLNAEVGRFVDQTLDGSVSPFIAYLGDGQDLTDEEFAKLKQLVRDFEKRRKDDKK